MIAIVNTSTLVSRAAAETMVAACAKQVHQHFAPSWSRLPSTPTLYPSVAAVPKGMPTILLVDDSDDPGALGYHTESGDGRVTGIVAARPVLDEGGEMLTGQLSVSSVLSHEVLETAIDPWVGGWEDAPDGRSWAREVGDPVQADSYAIAGTSVSNFVLPQFFNAMPPVGVKFDWLGKLVAPFTIAAGGYAIVRHADGKIEQLGFRPAWKRSPRTNKRRGA